MNHREKKHVTICNKVGYSTNPKKDGFFINFQGEESQNENGDTNCYAIPYDNTPTTHNEQNPEKSLPLNGIDCKSFNDGYSPCTALRSVTSVFSLVVSPRTSRTPAKSVITVITVSQAVTCLSNSSNI